jgi:hypothetical protein
MPCHHLIARILLRSGFVRQPFIERRQVVDEGCRQCSSVICTAKVGNEP